MENDEPKEGADEIKIRRQALESKREALLTKLKNIDSQAKYKSYEARALRTVLKGKRRPDARGLRRRLEMLEFKVQTEASTLQMERQLMKEIKKTEKEIVEATAEDRQFRKLAYLESDLLECEKEMDHIEKELQETNAEISELEKASRDETARQMFEERERKKSEYREKKRKEKKEEQKKETEPYMTKIEPLVSLEDICVIRKKSEKSDQDQDL